MRIERESRKPLTYKITTKGDLNVLEKPAS